MDLQQATAEHVDEIWQILQFAIEQRRLDGSAQWQDGYPNLATVKNDVAKGCGHVLVVNGRVAGYVAVLMNDEPAYANIEGAWLTNAGFMVVHRVAVAQWAKGMGMAEKLFVILEGLAKQNGIFSIKVDTNFDNAAMLHILQKLGYLYCGKVYFRGAARMAFEKVL